LQFSIIYLQNIYNHIISTIKESAKDNGLNIYREHVQTFFLKKHMTQISNEKNLNIIKINSIGKDENFNE